MKSDPSSNLAITSDTTAGTDAQQRLRTLNETIPFDASYNRKRDDKQSHTTTAIRVRHPGTAGLGRANISASPHKHTYITESGITCSCETPQSEELDRSRAESSCRPYQGQDNKQGGEFSKGRSEAISDIRFKWTYGEDWIVFHPRSSVVYSNEFAQYISIAAQGFDHLFVCLGS